MKVRAKSLFYDENGIHRKGEVIDVKTFRPGIMEAVDEKPAKAEKKPEPDPGNNSGMIETTPKKAPAKKKTAGRKKKEA